MNETRANDFYRGNGKLNVQEKRKLFIQKMLLVFLQWKKKSITLENGDLSIESAEKLEFSFKTLYIGWKFSDLLHYELAKSY